MHDPMTMAFEIKYPWRDGHGTYRAPFITIWHVDPEKDGTDDSCGWFMRARHCDDAVLGRIVKRFEFEWDRIFDPNESDSDDDEYRGSKPVYFCGLFKPDGDPNMSVHGIVLNLFFIAAGEHFESNGHTNWKRARKWMNDNLFDILLFAENPTDSLCDDINRKFAKGCNESYTKRVRDERIRQMACSIYSWICRHERPWWRHPKWHWWHWRIQVHPLQRLRRWLLTRCEVCGGRFTRGQCAVGNWDSPPRRWFESFRGERGLRHSECDNVHVKVSAKENS